MGSPEDEVGEIAGRLRRLGVPGLIVEAIERLIRVHIDEHDRSVQNVSPNDIARLGRALHSQALQRTEVLGVLLNNIPLNMLLDLAAAEAHGRGVRVSSLCIAGGGPLTTSLRYIRWLEEQGLVQCEIDEADRSSFLVNLTDAGRPKVHDAILAMSAPLRLG